MRVSRTVLRGAGGEIPPAYSPQSLIGVPPINVGTGLIPAIKYRGASQRVALHLNQNRM